MPFLSRFRKQAASVRTEKTVDTSEDVLPKQKPVGVVARLMGLDMFPPEGVVGNSKKQAEENSKVCIPEKPIDLLKSTSDVKISSKQINALAGLPPLGIPFSEIFLQSDTSSKVSENYFPLRESLPVRNHLAPRNNVELQSAIHSAAFMQPWQLEELNRQLVARQAEAHEKLNEAKLLIRGERRHDMPRPEAHSRPDRTKDFVETLNFLHSNRNLLLTQLGQQVLLGASSQVSQNISPKGQQKTVTAKSGKIGKAFTESATNLKTSAKQSKDFTKLDKVTQFPKKQLGSRIFPTREVKSEQLKGTIDAGKEVTLQHQRRQSFPLVKSKGSDKGSNGKESQKNLAVNPKEMQKNLGAAKPSLTKGQVLKPLTSPSISPRFYASVQDMKSATRQGNSDMKRAVEQEARKEVRPAKDKFREVPLDSKEIATQVATKIKKGVIRGFEVNVENDASCMIRNKGSLSVDRKRTDGDDVRGISDGESIPSRRHLRYYSTQSSISLPSSPGLGVKGAATVSTEEGKRQLLERLKDIKVDQIDLKQSRVSSQSDKLAQRPAGRHSPLRSDVVSESYRQIRKHERNSDPSKQFDDSSSQRSTRKHSLLGRNKGSADISRENSPRMGTVSQLFISSEPIERTFQERVNDCFETSSSTGRETSNDKVMSKIRKGSSNRTMKAIMTEEAVMTRRNLGKEGIAKESKTSSRYTGQLTSSRAHRCDRITRTTDHLSDCEVEERYCSSRSLATTSFVEDLPAGNPQDRRTIHGQYLHSYGNSMQKLIQQSFDECPQVLADESLSCSTETASLCNAFDEVSQEDYSLSTPGSKFPSQDLASTGETIFHPNSPKTEKLSPVSVLESVFEEIDHERLTPGEFDMDAKLSESLLKHQQPLAVNTFERLKPNLHEVREAKETVARQISYFSEPFKKARKCTSSESIATEREEIDCLSKDLLCPKGLEFHLEYFLKLLLVAGIGSPKINTYQKFSSFTTIIDSSIFHRFKEQYMNYQLEKCIEGSIRKQEKVPIMSYFKIENERGLDEVTQCIIFDITNMYLIELQRYNCPWILTGKADTYLCTSRQFVQQVWREVCDCFSQRSFESENPLEVWLESDLAKENGKMKLWQEVDELGLEIEKNMFDDLVEEALSSF
ncbi:hypothetical protein O6H91_08G011700 [Diphasiastrum complanatum]|uniref:Uncharacterized protein n=1 Tax=Diphasiastrum complanatum TaxID=34168 RepID=A0ACC2CUZ8_DIPCM|nr:hypothetical protein O6H91_08G011700 [Diphasiastrum complanatum]